MIPFKDMRVEMAKIVAFAAVANVALRIGGLVAAELDLAGGCQLTGEDRRIRETMARCFPAPKDAASELLLSQFQHAMGMKMACGGKWKPVQHLARRFFAPLSIVGSPAGRIVAMNDTAEAVRGEAVIETWSYDGKLQSSVTHAVTLPPGSATHVSNSSSTTNSAFLLLRLKTPAGEVVNDWHFARYRDVPLADARIDVRIDPTSSDRTFAVMLSASAPAFFVWADVPGVRGEFDDNAFTLVPGCPKTIVFTAREPTSWWAFKDRLSVVSLSDLVSDKPVPGPTVKTAYEIPDGRPRVRWRGFNLNQLYNRDWNPDAVGYNEDDVRMIAELGFNFVRLTLDYRYWIPNGDRAHWTEFDEKGLKKIDRALELAEKYGLHVQLALYRLPGYASGGDAEPTDLFSDAEPLRVAAAHWRMLAARYRAYGNERLTFNLINEPNFMPEAKYAPVVRALVAAIREVDESRYLFADGVDYGRIPTPSLYGIPRLGQSYHAYDPHGVTHYRAPWVNQPQVEPVWPPKSEKTAGPRARPAYADAGRDFISRKSFAQWNAALAAGVFVNVGEFGVWKKTPHAVTLALMEDELSLFKDRNLGWALWEFRGGFGILDSDREDVVYEDFHGHKLDRKMLELLRRY